MANTCLFEMKVKGDKENIEEFIDILNSTYNYELNKDGLLEDKLCKKNHFYRIFKTNVIDFKSNEKESFAIIDGECAWSVYSCMLEGPHTYHQLMNDDKEKYKKIKGTHILEVSKKLNLQIEIFAEEPLTEFKEHYLIDNGRLKIDECMELVEGEEEIKQEYCI